MDQKVKLKNIEKQRHSIKTEETLSLREAVKAAYVKQSAETIEGRFNRMLRDNANRVRSANNTDGLMEGLAPSQIQIYERIK